VNLDPAAENFDYPVAMGKQNVFCCVASSFVHLGLCLMELNYFSVGMFADVRELISLDDVMEELGLGPNGGLVYCMEYPFHLFN